MSKTTSKSRRTAVTLVAVIAVWLCSTLEYVGADTAIRVVGVHEDGSTAVAKSDYGAPPAVDVKPIFATSKPQAPPRAVAPQTKPPQPRIAQRSIARPNRQSAKRPAPPTAQMETPAAQVAIKSTSDAPLESGVFITLAVPHTPPAPKPTIQSETVVAAGLSIPEPPVIGELPSYRQETPTYEVAVHQTVEDAIPTPVESSDAVVAAPPAHNEYVPAPTAAPYACNCPTCPNCPGQSGATTICGVYCSSCQAACNATWNDMRRIPWSIFAQGEYVGPARREHVFQYFIRVDDQIDLIYMQARDKTSVPYVVGVGDQLRIERATEENLGPGQRGFDRTVEVQTDGTITLPQIGEVVASGKTIAALREEINKYYEVDGAGDEFYVTPLTTNVPVLDVINSVDARGGAGGQTQSVRVTPEGTIQAPGIGSVYVQGLTLDELRREVEARYEARYGPGLRITPLLAQRAPSYIFVGGEVVTPGRYTLEGPTTVMQAIAMAGSWKVGGNTNQIVVFRRDENWCLKATKIDLFKPLYGKDPCPVNDVWLRDNDLVLIPKRPIKVVDDIIELYMTRGVYSAFPINFVYNFTRGSSVVPIAVGP